MLVYSFERKAYDVEIIWNKSPIFTTARHVRVDPTGCPEYMYLPCAKNMIQFVSYLAAVHLTYNETIGTYYGDWLTQ